QLRLAYARAEAVAGRVAKRAELLARSGGRSARAPRRSMQRAVARSAAKPFVPGPAPGGPHPLAAKGLGIRRPCPAGRLGTSALEGLFAAPGFKQNVWPIRPLAGPPPLPLARDSPEPSATLALPARPPGLNRPLP